MWEELMGRNTGGPHSLLLTFSLSRSLSLSLHWNAPPEANDSKNLWYFKRLHTVLNTEETRSPPPPPTLSGGYQQGQADFSGAAGLGREELRTTSWCFAPKCLLLTQAWSCVGKITAICFLFATVGWMDR